MNTSSALWAAVSLATFTMQLALGTDITFACASLAIFLLLPVGFRNLLHANSVGAILFVATFIKLFIPAQWVKIVLFQEADSYLDSPTETVFAILLAMVGYCVAAALLRVTLPAVPVQLMRPSSDPAAMRRIGLATFALAVFAYYMRSRTGLDRLGWDPLSDGPVQGQGLVVWTYLAYLLPLVPGIFVARRMSLSGGRQWIDGYVIGGIIVAAAAGVWANSRTEMFAGAVAAYLTYLVHGGKIRKLHLALVVSGAMAVHWVVFPFIDIQRSLPPNLSVKEYLEHSAELGVQVLNGDRENLYTVGYLSELYEGWWTRLYYGEPTGFLDRFTPSQVDEAVTYFSQTGLLGAEYTSTLLWSMVPNIVRLPLGIEAVEAGGDLMEVLIWNRLQSSSMNYGIIAEMYAYVGLIGLPILCTAAVFFHFFFLHMICGGLRRNYLAAFFAQNYLFAMADAEIGELYLRTFSQSFVYVVLFAGAGLAQNLWANRISRRVPHSAPSTLSGDWRPSS